MVITLDKSNPDLIVSCYNWTFIQKDQFPSEYNQSNIKEDFNLLFQDNIDHQKLKECLRTSVREPNQAVRKFLWKRILIHDTSQLKLTIDKYTQKISVLFGKNLQLKAELPDFVDREHLCFFYLNELGKQAVYRLLNVLASVHPDITFAPLLVPLASLFLHYMNEPECFACLLSVVESNNKITQTDIHWITTNYVFRRFAQKYAHPSYEYLLEALYKQTNDPEMCFEVIDNWQWWIFESLPFNYILNIVDCFLLEGQKTLYRFGLAILDTFYKSTQNRPLSLKINCMKDFCARITIPYERLLKTAFNYRNMSRKDIDSVFQAEEKIIKKMRNKNESITTSAPRPEATDYKKKIYSAILGPFLKSHLIQDLEENHRKLSITSLGQNKTLEKNEKSSSWTSPLKKLVSPGKKWYMNTQNSSTHSFYHHHHPQSNLNLPSFSLETIGSQILCPEQISTLWRWLPTRYQILELQLIYSTNIHGCRLMTLMDKIEYYQSTILVVKTTTNSIFGAFCSMPWSERISKERSYKPKFFGNGETFLFELAPRVEKYEWIGKSEMSKGRTTNSQEMFMYADMEKLVVGGGCEKGVGLLINSDLIYGRTSVSDTFENKILGQEADFEIAVLEVLSFKSAEG
ncbi:unnamed protein product [Brachionus calyciflorus]|uniref:TLDc domain-containing protein n=1 Tax=Brachionus calyciflorus TaxID=104777 RepID=A0A814LGQ9_9BILA|nr:unnamed protein product [Brachionus calyciflorus]